MLGETLVSGSSTPLWIDVANLVMVPLALIGSFVVAASIARREYRMKFLTNEWSNLMSFVFEHSDLMDRERNQAYLTSYASPDAAKRYEIFARICIGYVDDLFFLGFGSAQKDWLKGAVPLLVGSHSAWFRDNHAVYDDEFVEHVEQVLADCGI